MTGECRPLLLHPAPFRDEQRPGRRDIPAVANNRIVQIKSALILQPRQAALTDGLDAIVKACGRRPPGLRSLLD